jgi:hypothetical protein
MNYFLILIILCLGGGGYYEYTTMQQQMSDQDSQIKKLQSDNADLKTKLETAATSPAPPPKPEQPATPETPPDTSAAAPGTSSASAKPSTPPASAAPSAPSANSNQLGTISTVDGKTYQNCRLLKVKATGIVVNDSDGITEIGFIFMPANVQQRFGYDPKAGPNLSDSRVLTDEALRQAAKD